MNIFATTVIVPWESVIWEEEGIWALRNKEQKLFERLGSDIMELHCSWNCLQQLQGPFLKN